MSLPFPTSDTEAPLTVTPPALYWVLPGWSQASSSRLTDTAHTCTRQDCHAAPQRKSIKVIHCHRKGPNFSARNSKQGETPQNNGNKIDSDGTVFKSCLCHLCKHLTLICVKGTAPLTQTFLKDLVLMTVPSLQDFQWTFLIST